MLASGAGLARESAGVDVAMQQRLDRLAKSSLGIVLDELDRIRDKTVRQSSPH